MRESAAGFRRYLELDPGLALAHGKLLRATPAAGSRTATAPRESTLTSSEKIEPAFVRTGDEHRFAGRRRRA